MKGLGFSVFSERVHVTLAVWRDAAKVCVLEMSVISIQPAFSRCTFKCKQLNISKRQSSGQLIRACKPRANLNTLEEHQLPENLLNIVKSFQLVRFMLSIFFL